MINIYRNNVIAEHTHMQGGSKHFQEEYSIDRLLDTRYKTVIGT